MPPLEPLRPPVCDTAITPLLCWGHRPSSSQAPPPLQKMIWALAGMCPILFPSISGMAEESSSDNWPTPASLHLRNHWTDQRVDGSFTAAGMRSCGWQAAGRGGVVGGRGPAGGFLVNYMIILVLLFPPHAVLAPEPPSYSWGFPGWLEGI